MICWIEFSAGFALGSDEGVEEEWVIMNIHSQITDSDDEFAGASQAGLSAIEITRAVWRGRYKRSRFSAKCWVFP
jgi:hypothetical protein